MGEKGNTYRMARTAHTDPMNKQKVKLKWGGVRCTPCGSMRRVMTTQQQAQKWNWDWNSPGPDDPWALLAVHRCLQHLSILLGS